MQRAKKVGTEERFNSQYLALSPRRPELVPLGPWPRLGALSSRNSDGLACGQHDCMTVWMLIILPQFATQSQALETWTPTRCIRLDSMIDRDDRTHVYPTAVLRLITWKTESALIINSDTLLTSSEEGPRESLLSALDTLLLLSIWERTESLLVEGDTQRLGSCRWRLRVFCRALGSSEKVSAATRRSCESGLTGSYSSP
jgi:hypothetical protein